MTESHISILKIINDFNQRVINAHNAHYKNGIHQLIHTSKNASLNGNIIYHLYSTGEITYQKGAWAYLQRSEFNSKYDITGAKKLPFKFVNEKSGRKTYAVLTKEECQYFREEMVNIVKHFSSFI